MLSISALIFGGIYLKTMSLKIWFIPSVCLFIVAVIDGIDGGFARLTNRQNSLGVFIDEFIDYIGMNLLHGGVSLFYGLIGVYGLIGYNVDRFLKKTLEVEHKTLGVKTRFRPINFFVGVEFERVFMSIILLLPVTLTKLLYLIYYGFVWLRAIIHFFRVYKIKRKQN